MCRIVVTPHFFPLNHFSMPLPWSRNLQQCHSSSNFKNWYTHQFPLENQLHIKCSFRVNFITLCHGVPNIAIRSIVSDSIACFFFALQGSPYLFGYVFRVHRVDHIPNRESQTFHILFAVTVKVVGDGTGTLFRYNTPLPNSYDQSVKGLSPQCT